MKYIMTLIVVSFVGCIPYVPKQYNQRYSEDQLNMDYDYDRDRDEYDRDRGYDRDDRNRDEYNRKRDYSRSYDCMESNSSNRDLMWRVGNVLNSTDRYSGASSITGLIGYIMDYSNSRNHRGCR